MAFPTCRRPPRASAALAPLWITPENVRMTREEQADLVTELLAPIPRTAVVPAVRAALGISHKLSDRVVQAFDDYVAKPMEANLKKLHGRDLAKRNPMIYTTRGADSVEEWAD